jgi:hypothetical protein
VLEEQPRRNRCSGDEMSSATVNAERRLRKRVSACAYNPLPQEIADIDTLLRMLDILRAHENGMTRMALALGRQQAPRPKRPSEYRKER